jgi:hypothetical protein
MTTKIELENQLLQIQKAESAALLEAITAFIETLDLYISPNVIGTEAGYIISRVYSQTSAFRDEFARLIERTEAALAPVAA